MTLTMNGGLMNHQVIEKRPTMWSRFKTWAKGFIERNIIGWEN